MNLWLGPAAAWHLSFGDQDEHTVLLVCGLAFAPFLLVVLVVYVDRRRALREEEGAEEGEEESEDAGRPLVRRRARRTPGRTARGGR